MATNIYEESTSFSARVARWLLAQDAHAGAQPVLYAALADIPGSFTGAEHLAHMRGGAELIKRSKTAKYPVFNNPRRRPNLTARSPGPDVRLALVCPGFHGV